MTSAHCGLGLLILSKMRVLGCGQGWKTRRHYHSSREHPCLPMGRSLGRGWFLGTALLFNPLTPHPQLSALPVKRSGDWNDEDWVTHSQGLSAR